MIEKNRRATIESLVTDMGNGGSWCSGCKYDLTSYLRNYFSLDSDKRSLTGRFPEKDLSTFIEKNELECPNCESYLEFGEKEIEPYPFGGSDF